MANTETPLNRCPTCNSSNPKLHPAVQFEGEVQLCYDSWHRPTAAEIEAGWSEDEDRKAAADDYEGFLSAWEAEEQKRCS